MNAKYRTNNARNGLELFFDEVPAPNVREQLKAAGYRWSRFGGYWYNLNTPEALAVLEQLGATPNAEGVPGTPCSNKAPHPSNEKEAPSSRCTITQTDGRCTITHTRNKELIAEAGRMYGDEDYFNKSVFDAFKASNGQIVCIDKKHLKKDFCFGEHGYDFDEVVKIEHDSRCFEYFEAENLRGIEEWIKDLSDPNNADQLYLVTAYYTTNGLANLRICRSGDYKEMTPATPSDIAAALRIYKAQLEDMRKRCRVWWKKNGAEGLHTWTYWADA